MQDKGTDTLLKEGPLSHERRWGTSHHPFLFRHLYDVVYSGNDSDALGRTQPDAILNLVLGRIASIQQDEVIM